MVIQNLLAFRRAKEKKAKKILRKTLRRISVRSHSAWLRDHDCCKCSAPISGGMSYVREFWISDSRSFVKKFHFPICPDHYHREEENLREEENTRNARKVA